MGAPNGFHPGESMSKTSTTKAKKTPTKQDEVSIEEPATEKSTAVVVAETTAIAVPEPNPEEEIKLAISALQALAAGQNDDVKAQILELAYLVQPEIEGMEEMETTASLPSIYIRQPSSGSDAIPTDCKIGDLYDTNGAGHADSFLFIPVFGHNVRKKWTDEGLECLSLDGKTGSKYGKCDACPYGAYQEGVRPDCSKGLSYYVVANDLTGLYRIDFSKTSAKAGRNIKKLSRPPAMWGRVFKLTTDRKEGQQNSKYYVYNTQFTGDNTSEEVRRICKGLHTVYRAIYHGAVQRQTEFAARAALEATASTGAGTPTVVVSSDDNIPDFSESI